jgi:hypothetical protein
MQQSAGSSAAKLVLLVLAEAADATGFTFLGQAELASRAELTRRTVLAQMAALEERQLITRERRFDPRTGFRTSDGVRLGLEILGETDAPRTDIQGEPVAPRRAAYVKSTQGLGENDCVENVVNFTVTGQEPVIEPIGVDSLSDQAPTLRLVATSGEPLPDAFEAWWEVYPRKDGRKPARLAFEKVLREGRATLHQLMDGATAYAGARAGKDPTKTKMAQGWLNDERWADEPRSPDQTNVEDSRTQWSRSPAPDYLAMAAREYGRG